MVWDYHSLPHRELIKNPIFLNNFKIKKDMMYTILIIAVLVEGYLLYKLYKEKQSIMEEVEAKAANIESLMAENAQLTASLAKANDQMKPSQKKATKTKSAKAEVK